MRRLRRFENERRQYGNDVNQCVNVTGIDYLQSKFAAWILQQLGNFPADALQIFYIGGGGVFLNWIFGAIAFIASIKATSHLTATMKKT